MPLPQTRWAARGALQPDDISGWGIAGTYATRAPARHHYDVGLSYATQRYDGGNPAALRDVTDGSRNAGALYGFDTWTVSPGFTVAYGTRYARYDYLENKNLLSPRVSMTLAPGDHFRVNASVARRSIAPGAEEFLPPGDSGIWLPPQRTFSSVTNGGPLDAEQTTHLQVEVERDLGQVSTLSLRAFQQYVDDQLITMFGMDVPGQAPAKVGHYFIGKGGDVDARGLTAALRTGAGRVRGSVEYSMTRPNGKGRPALLPPAALEHLLRPERIHDVSTSIAPQCPKRPRVLVHRISSSSLARRTPLDENSSPGSMSRSISRCCSDFSTAKWEMLIGIRPSGKQRDQSVLMNCRRQAPSASLAADDAFLAGTDFPILNWAFYF